MTEGHTAEHWLGRSVKRKEDDRFLQGKGNYVDDINLPGMLHMSILRSPVAHARINSIDTSAAAALPGVVAVVTGELLAQHNLAWMPTLSGDTQAVLATDKVRMQGQEVACVIAEDPYVAHDALELIEVDYDPLPVVITPQQSLEPGAPVIRDDKEDKQDNRIYHWEAGDAEATDRAFAEADRVVSLDTFYPRCHPAPMETCGCVADVNPVTGKATIYMTSQAPHAHRTVFALVAGLPEHQIQIISPDIGGGFGNKVPIYPGYVVATAASLLLGRPVKWIEDRTGNLISTGFARDFYMKGELALREDGKMLGLRVNMLSDQGYAYADAQPSKLRAGLFHIVTGSYDIPRPTWSPTAPTPTRRPAGSPTAARSGSPRPRSSSSASSRRPPTSSGSTRSSCAAGTSSSPSSSPTPRPPGSCTTRATTRRPGQGPGDARLRGPQGRAGQGQGRGQADRDRAGHLHRGGRGRAEQGLRHPRPEDVRLGRAAGPPDRQGDPQDRRPDPGPGPRDDLRPDRGQRARHPALRHPGPARRHRQHPLRAGHLRLPEHPDGRGGHGHGLAQAARQGQAAGRPPAGGRPRGPGVGSATASRSGAPPTARRPSRRPPSPPTPTTPRGWRRAWRGSPTTTRPT